MKSELETHVRATVAVIEDRIEKSAHFDDPESADNALVAVGKVTAYTDCRDMLNRVLAAACKAIVVIWLLLPSLAYAGEVL